MQEVRLGSGVQFVFHGKNIHVRVIQRNVPMPKLREETGENILARIWGNKSAEFQVIRWAMFQRIRVTLTPNEPVAVGHMTILYLETVQKCLTVEPVIERNVTALELTRPIPK